MSTSANQPKLLTKEEQEAVSNMRRILGSGNADVTEQLIAMLEKTDTNEEFVAKLQNWSNAYEKDGFTMGKSFIK